MRAPRRSSPSTTPLKNHCRRAPRGPTGWRRSSKPPHAAVPPSRRHRSSGISSTGRRSKFAFDPTRKSTSCVADPSPSKVGASRQTPPGAGSCCGGRRYAPTALRCSLRPTQRAQAQNSPCGLFCAWRAPLRLQAQGHTGESAQRADRFSEARKPARTRPCRAGLCARGLDLGVDLFHRHRRDTGRRNSIGDRQQRVGRLLAFQRIGDAGDRAPAASAAPRPAQPARWHRAIRFEPSSWASLLCAVSLRELLAIDGRASHRAIGR